MLQTRTRATNDYSLFSYYPENRDINEGHVKHLMRSISTINLLELVPIIVDRDMNVLDGQHRLEAAKRLDVPIHFFQVKDRDLNALEAVKLLNGNLKRWTVNDYINLYVKLGVEDYKVLKNYCKRYGISPSVGIYLLTGATSDTSYKSGTGASFKNGEFKVTAFKFAEKVGDMYADYNKNLKKPFVKSKNFLEAVLKISSSKNYNHERMMHKLQLFGDKLEPRESSMEYQHALEDIYNFRQKTAPVRLF